MKTKQEIKTALKNWMMTTVRSTLKKSTLEGSNYQASDIAFAFRSKLGIKMDEGFVLKSLGMKDKNHEENRTKT
jgi:hypothetical protein